MSLSTRHLLFAGPPRQILLPHPAKQRFNAASAAEAAARAYLASPLGLVVRGTTVSVPSIFKWYGDDFIAQIEQEK